MKINKIRKHNSTEPSVVPAKKMIKVMVKSILSVLEYRNVPKFSDRQVWANSADPDQTTPLGAYNVCHSIWMHYSMVMPPCSNCSVITAHFSGVQIFRIFTLH